MKLLKELLKIKLVLSFELILFLIYFKLNWHFFVSLQYNKCPAILCISAAL
ncbi:hypothetical protein M2326_001402 [Flavobacterium sp. 7A]|nr:hypothetical protein [Flavobacterium sp. 7A]